MPTDTEPLKKKTRVVLAEDLPGVPEGTGGKVARSVGLTLVRYRVAFDNGVSKLGVAGRHLVPEAEWEDFKAERARKAEAAATAASEPPAAEPSGDDEAPAEAKKPAADDRMAALLARSKAAKEKKLAAGG